MQKIKITPILLSEEIYVDHDIADFIIKKIKDVDYEKILFFVDKHLFSKQKKYIEKLVKKSGACGIVFINPKAHYKDFEYCGCLLKKLIIYKLNRKSCLVAVGGGFVADMVGFISSIFMRGIDFIQIPTTMMSMSDAVIGKVAVNFRGLKNLLGSFYFPKFVFIDRQFLKTLSEKEIVYGLVEVWKHALLVADYKIIQMIENYLSSSVNLDEEKIIKFSLRVKKQFVQVDYNDKVGIHKALSLGHTLANYLELTLALRHGPAVFYGIIFEVLLSYNLKTINKKKFVRIIKTAKLFESKIALFGNVQEELRIVDVIRKLKFDKINNGNLYTFIVLTSGGFYVKKDIKSTVLAKVFSQFKKLMI